MDSELANTLWLAITQIEAMEALLAMKIADFPHSKDEHREKFHKAMFKAAYPNQKKAKLSLDDLEKRLRDGR